MDNKFKDLIKKYETIKENAGDYPLGTSDNPLTGHPENPLFNFRTEPRWDKNYVQKDPPAPLTGPEKKAAIAKLEAAIDDAMRAGVGIEELIQLYYKLNKIRG